MKLTSAILSALFLCLSAGTLPARELPQGPGLAAGYDGDQGIAGDSSVVFVEEFEEGSLDTLFARWNDVSNTDDAVIGFSSDRPEGSPGKKSLKMTARNGQNTGGHLFRLLGQGYDQLFVRFYTKFSSDHGFLHHFVRLRGLTDGPAYPEGNLDKSPNPNACGIDIEPVGEIFGQTYPLAPVGLWTLSAFWHEMKSWQGEGGTSFYPDIFPPTDSLLTARDRWYCVEAMLKLNSSPDAYDGEMALWIDGKLVSHLGPGTETGYWNRDTYIPDEEHGTPFEGFNWRNNMQLQLNRFWLLYYVSPDAYNANHGYVDQHPEVPLNPDLSSVFFDHIVIARDYIGPMGPEKWGSLPEGDYDGDGSLGISDVVRLAKRQYSNPGSLALDFNGDGKVNIMDALSLLLRLRA